MSIIIKSFHDCKNFKILYVTICHKTDSNFTKNENNVTVMET